MCVCVCVSVCVRVIVYNKTLSVIFKVEIIVFSSLKKKENQ